MREGNFKRLILELSAVGESAYFHSLNDCKKLPTRDEAVDILREIISLMFPIIAPHKTPSACQAESAERLFVSLKSLLYAVSDKDNAQAADDRATEILYGLPTVKEALIKDAVAIYEGDPAARSIYEVMLCYPGFFAIMVQRIAHAFFIRNIPYLPRMMTEYAHEKTGIDIHPGAVIGESFCIDHGTGVVIGETAEIGDGVKIYQGVTIGAKSFEKDERGVLIKGKKRHPKIGDNCIIYAGATILGGDTVIGDGCIIGGNVWLTHSLPPGRTVYYDNKK